MKMSRIAFLMTVAAAVSVGGSCSVARELQDIEPISFTTGTIAGTVTDSLNHNPIVGARITLLTADGDSVRDQTSSAFSFAPLGEYRFGNVRPGSYVLRAQAAGYQMATKTIAGLTVGERYTISFQLRPAE